MMKRSMDATVRCPLCREQYQFSDPRIPKLLPCGLIACDECVDRRGGNLSCGDCGKRQALSEESRITPSINEATVREKVKQEAVDTSSIRDVLIDAPKVKTEPESDDQTTGSNVENTGDLNPGESNDRRIVVEDDGGGTTGKDVTEKVEADQNAQISSDPLPGSSLSGKNDPTTRENEPVESTSKNLPVKSESKVEKDDDDEQQVMLCERVNKTKKALPVIMVDDGDDDGEDDIVVLETENPVAVTKKEEPPKDFKICAQHGRDLSLFCKDSSCGAEICHMCLIHDHVGHNVVDILEVKDGEVGKEVLQFDVPEGAIDFTDKRI